MIAYLKLVRLPNVFTSVSNVIAGGVIGAASMEESLSWRTPVLAAASAALYMAGMAFNDFADRVEDAKFRPGRPIPSGKVSPAGAFMCALFLMVLGLALAALVSLSSLYLAVSLAIMILLYDFGTTGIPVLGALTLGACRFFNVLLGLSAGMTITSGVFNQPPLEVPLAPALIMGLYAAGVTAFSAQEEEGRDRRAGFIGWLFIDAAMLIAVLSTKDHFAIPLLAMIWTVIFYHSYKVRTQGTPVAARNMIRTAVMGIPVLDAAMIIGFAGFANFPWGLVCIALLIPSLLIGKWLVQKEA